MRFDRFNPKPVRSRRREAIVRTNGAATSHIPARTTNPLNVFCVPVALSFESLLPGETFLGALAPF